MTQIKHSVGIVGVEDEFVRTYLCEADHSVIAGQEVLGEPLGAVASRPIVKSLVQEIEDLDMVRIVANNQLVLVAKGTEGDLTSKSGEGPD